MTLDPHDPFGERIALPVRVRVSVLGADVSITSNDAKLTELAVEAYGALPSFETGAPATQLTVAMVLNDCVASWPLSSIPAAPVLSSGAGLLYATIDAGNCVIIDPANARAVISVSRAMLQHPYLVRYEMIEFAVLTLAARVRSLIALHAASIGAGERGCLIVGASGTGKSTICLMAVDHGLTVLSEDSTFIEPRSLDVYGVPNFLHLRTQSPDLFGSRPLSELIAGSPVIQRRSGVYKFELDLRRLELTETQKPLQLAATIFLTTESASKGPKLLPLRNGKMLSRMSAEQPYAAGQPGWDEFCEGLAALPCFELRRTDPPAAAVRELRALLT